MRKRRTGGRWSWQSLGLELKNVNWVVTATWLLTSQSAINSAAIIWPASAETGRSATRSQAASWRAPLAPRWSASGPALSCRSQARRSAPGQGEFLRLLYIIAHRRATRWFQRHSNDEPSEDAFKFRRGQYFWHTRCSFSRCLVYTVTLSWSFSRSAVTE